VSWSQVVNDWNPKRDDHKLAVVNIPHIFSFLNPDMKRSETLESFKPKAWDKAVEEGEAKLAAGGTKDD
jgi:hypothetical protein